jgi:hypothetical protein
VRRTDLKTGDRPHNAPWNWVQFGCAFTFVGFVAFLHIDPPLDGLGVHLLKTLIIAGTCAWLAGRFGASIWRGIVTFLWYL